TSPYARNRRERGLDPRVSTLPFQRFNQGGFFPADIRAATGLHVKFQVVSAPQNVLSEEAFFPRFGNGLFQYPDHVEQFSPDVYIRSVRAQRETGNDHAFNEGMWVADHEVAVFECPRFAFIRVADQITGHALGLGQETPLQPGRESCTAAPAQP